MIHVEKKELAERRFTPFEIKLTISDEKDLLALKAELADMRSECNSFWYRLNRRYGAIKSLLDLIDSHTK